MEATKTESTLAVEIKCGHTWTPIPLDMLRWEATEEIAEQRQGGSTSGQIEVADRTYRWRTN